MGGISSSAPPKIASVNQQIQGATPSTGNFYSNPQPQQNSNSPFMGGGNYASFGNPMGENAPQYNPGLDDSGMGGAVQPLGNPNVNPNPVEAPRQVAPPTNPRSFDKMAMMLRHPQMFGKRRS